MFMQYLLDTAAEMLKWCLSNASCGLELAPLSLTDCCQDALEQDAVAAVVSGWSWSGSGFILQLLTAISWAVIIFSPTKVAIQTHLQ